MTIPTLFRRTSLTLAALGSALVLACGTEGGTSGSPPPVPQDGGTGVQVDGGPATPDAGPADGGLATPDAGPADAGAQVPDGGLSLHGLLPADGGGTILWPDHSITRPTGRVHIVEIGDSITQGGGPGNTREISYRYPLWRKLVLARANFDMVGSLQAGFENDPPWPDVNGVPFDRDHEGHWGWPLNGIRDELAGWLQGYTPDIALVMLGTNDPGDEPDRAHPERGMAVEAGEIIDLLRADNPRVIIVFAPPFHEWAPFPAFRAEMETLVRQRTTAQSPLLLVDHSPGWISNPGAEQAHTLDWVHTNAAGDEKLAANFMSALAPLLNLR